MIARFRILTILALLFSSASFAHAASITLNFSGTVNSTLFSGSVSWDPAAPNLLVSGAGFARYQADTATMFIDGNDDSAKIQLGGQSYLQVDNSGGFDAFRIIYSFFPAATFGYDIFIAPLTGPVTMFTNTDLPTDLSFLSAVTSKPAIFTCFSECTGETTTLDVSAPSVPEPASLLLVGSGVGMLVRRRRSRRR